MPLQFLIDENLRGTLAVVLRRCATRMGLDINVMQVGDFGTLPLGSSDEDLLQWCEEADFVLVSNDRRTLPTHLAKHLAAGHRSPGVLLLRGKRLTDLAEHLLLIAYATEPQEWENRIAYVP